jgi:ribosome-associated toxin RatA of RatAB toxin-antitoxin module
MSRRGILLGGIAWAIAMAPHQSALGDTRPADFTPDELLRLQRGELVVRATQEQRLIGGSSWQLIDAKIDTVWSVVSDTAKYRQILPQVRESRLEQASGDDRLVFLRHGKGPFEASYYLNVHLERDRHEVRFRIDESRPRAVPSGWGLVVLRPYSEGRTLLAYAVMADIGSGVFRTLLRAIIHTWMLRVPKLVKRLVERMPRGQTGSTLSRCLPRSWSGTCARSLLTEPFTKLSVPPSRTPRIIPRKRGSATSTS